MIRYLQLRASIVLFYFYREVGDKDKGSLSLWIVAVCEKRLFRFILSIIILNKDKLIHWYFDARSLLLESSLTIYGSLRARKIGFFIQSQPGTFFPNSLDTQKKRRKTRIGARIKTLNRHRRVKEMLPSLPKTRLKLVRSSGQSSVDTGLGLTFLLNVRMNMHSFLYSMVEYGRLITNPIGNLNSRDQTSKDNIVKSERKKNAIIEGSACKLEGLGNSFSSIMKVRVDRRRPYLLDDPSKSLSYWMDPPNCSYLRSSSRRVRPTVLIGFHLSFPQQSKSTSHCSEVIGLISFSY